MTETEYLKLKEQIKAHATRRRNEIDAEEQKQLESLDTVWNFFSSMGVSLSQPATEKPEGAFPLAEAIRKVLPLIHGPFNITDIMRLVLEGGFDVKKPMNPTSVSGALRKLYDAGILELVEAGKGKRPSLYRIAEGRNVSSQSNLLPLEQKGQDIVPPTS